MIKESAMPISAPNNSNRSVGTSNRNALSPLIRKKGSATRISRSTAPVDAPQSVRTSLHDCGLVIIVQHLIFCLFNLVLAFVRVVVHDDERKEHYQGKTEEEICPCLFFHNTLPHIIATEATDEHERDRPRQVSTLYLWLGVIL